MKQRSGKYKTNLSGNAEYKSFDPAPLPPNPPLKLDAEGFKLVIEANKKLALLDESTTKIPNVNQFISMYVRKEALMTSQIEGTQATLEDVLHPKLEKNTNRDVAEVVNYIKAIEYALKRRQELPLCNRLLKETHAVLMEGVRGQDKNPGEFRSSQNWIGGTGSTIKTARYIPPTPEEMEKAMSDLEKYLHTDDDLDIVTRSGLIHYQFETIHPFLDGNGRIGRLLIILYLMEKNLLTSPALYISYFLKQNRLEYYDRMTKVRTDGDYEQWITFYLQAVIESATNAIDSIDELSALHNKNTEIINAMGRAAKTTMQVFTYLEAHPIIEIPKTANELNMAFNTVSSAVDRLIDARILRPTNTAQRNRTFAYSDYLDILRVGTE